MHRGLTPAQSAYSVFSVEELAAIFARGLRQLLATLVVGDPTML